jgi:choline-sulfatase
LTADHGLAIGKHGLMGKQNLYDCSIRMPLLISGPGIAAGKRIDELVYQHSMYATTCELLVWRLQRQWNFPALLLCFVARNGRHTRQSSAVTEISSDVRTKTHKLIVYPKIQKVQVFDLEKRTAGDA